MRASAAILFSCAGMASAWSGPRLAPTPVARRLGRLPLHAPFQITTASGTLVSHKPCMAALQLCRRSTRSSLLTMTSSDRAPVGKLVSAYQLVGLATAVVWIACSVVALSTHPNPRINAVCGLRHNSLTIAQALALPLPLLWSVFSALAAAASHGWDRLKSATYRRLNLGAAAASLWLAAAAARAPAFTTGHDMYPPILKVIAAVVHVITACVCLGAWVRTVDSSPPPVRGHYVPRIVRGVVGSVWRLAPTGVSDDPDAAGGRDGRNEWALAALLFGYFTVLPVVSRFPLATVPAMLGTRLSRAVSGFTFLSAVVCYTLKDAAERGRASASTFATLRRGLGLGCAAHLAVVSAKLIGIDGGGLLLPGRGLWQFYANAMAVPFAAATSLLMYGLVAFAAATPPREGVKERVLEGVDRLSSKVADKVADGVAEQLAQTDQDGAP